MLYQNRRKEVFLNGLLFNLPRGWDATGVAGIREVTQEGKKFSQIVRYKRALHFVDFMGTRGFNLLLNKFSDYYYVMGHVRHGTNGSSDEDQNAHPFTYGPITLIHNGHVDKSLLKVKADESVDSAHIACAMAEYGEFETLSMLDGGFALVWYNQKDDTLNIARNGKRPMSIAYVKGKNEMYYGSEAETLNAIMARNEVEIDGDILVPNEHVHYKFHKEDLRKWEAKAFKPYTRPSYNPPNGPWAGRHHYHGPQSQTPSSTGTPTPASAQHAASSTKTSSTPSGSSGGVASIGTPTIPRIAKMNEILAKFGWKYQSLLVVKPVDYSPPLQPETLGRAYFECLHHSTPHDVILCMYRVPKDRYEKYKQLGRVAVKVDNFVEQNDGVFRIVLKEDNDMQEVVERDDDVIQTLKEHGFAVDKQEGSKSTIKLLEHEAAKQAEADAGVAAGVIDTTTGEVSGIDEADVHSIEGPDGAWITPREFAEYARNNCGDCDGDIDITRPHSVSWHGEGIICPSCTAKRQVPGNLITKH